MAIHIPCLVEKPTKRGLSNWYWQPSAALAREGWKPLALGKDRESAMQAAETRNDEVERWRQGGKAPEGIAERHAAGTLAELIVRYRREHVLGLKPTGSPILKPASRASYETALTRIEAWGGKRALSWFTTPRVGEFGKRQLADTGHAPAFITMKVLRNLFAFAAAQDIIARNPASRYKIAPPPPRRQIWTDAHIHAFKATALDMGRPGLVLALDLALYTAQRAGDLIAFDETQWRPLTLLPELHQRFAVDGSVMGWCFDQGKISDEYAAVQMEIPALPELRARIEAALRTNRARDRAAGRLISHVLTDDRTGRPWAMRRFAEAWGEVRDAAAERCQLPAMRGLVWHDFRRTRVVHLRREGLNPQQIAAITGHSLAAIADMLRVYGPVDANVTAAALAAAHRIEEVA